MVSIVSKPAAPSAESYLQKAAVSSGRKHIENDWNPRRRKKTHDLWLPCCHLRGWKHLGFAVRNFVGITVVFFLSILRPGAQFHGSQTLTPTKLQLFGWCLGGYCGLDGKKWMRGMLFSTIVLWRRNATPWCHGKLYKVAFRFWMSRCQECTEFCLLGTEICWGWRITSSTSIVLWCHLDSQDLQDSEWHFWQKNRRTHKNNWKFFKLLKRLPQTSKACDLGFADFAISGHCALNLSVFGRFSEDFRVFFHRSFSIFPLSSLDFFGTHEAFTNNLHRLLGVLLGKVWRLRSVVFWLLWILQWLICTLVFQFFGESCLVF